VSVRIDEFDVPIELSLQEVTTRIVRWLHAGEPGTDYGMIGTSDNQVTIRKEKRDLRICGVSLFGTCGIIFLLVVLMIGSLYSEGLDAFYSIVAAVNIAGIIGFGGGFACYILNARKVTYVLEFGEGIPLRVTVYGEGQVEASKQDYDSLKSAIFHGIRPTAPW
jgi:hypothetical protein